MIGRACPPDLRPPVGQHISSPLLLGTWIQLSMACLWPGISCSPEPLSLSHSHLLGVSGQNIQPMAYCQPETLAFCLLIHYLILTNPVTDPHRPQSIEGEWHPLHSTLNINPRIFTYLQSFIYSADFYWLPAISLHYAMLGAEDTILNNIDKTPSHGELIDFISNFLKESA